MNIFLKGHDYKYAVEQSLFTLFPGCRPEYPEKDEGGDSITVSLSRGKSRYTATCRLRLEGKEYSARACAGRRRPPDPVETDRVCRSIVQTSIYRAALASGIQKPVWGSLSGVRPGKILSQLKQKYGNENDAVRHFISDYYVSPERAELCRLTERHTEKALNSLGEKDICLYVGIPFCPTRCAYCSFVSQSVEKSMKLIPPFLQALEKDIRATAEAVAALGLKVVSVYMGGGTPTTLSAQQLDGLCSLLSECFDLSGLREYTVEAGRPDTITADKLKVLRRHGVDRISVNPQTMSDTVLETIGRKHSAADIVKALELVRAEGGFAVNMDLIAGLPSDTPEGFRNTLEKVLALDPENITVHTLSLKKGSAITLKGTRVPTAAEVAEMLDDACRMLSQAGYGPYYLYRQKYMSGGFENTGWTKEGFSNLYNICIMEELCSIISTGGGASTKLIAPGNARNIRLTEPKYPLEYIELIEKTVSDKQKIIDFYNG